MKNLRLDGPHRLAEQGSQSRVYSHICILMFSGVKESARHLGCDGHFLSCHAKLSHTRQHFNGHLVKPFILQPAASDGSPVEWLRL